MRDAKMIAEKLQYVLLPKSREEKLIKLRNCTSQNIILDLQKWIFYIFFFFKIKGDLWGPLLLSLLLAL